MTLHYSMTFTREHVLPEIITSIHFELYYQKLAFTYMLNNSDLPCQIINKIGAIINKYEQNVCAQCNNININNISSANKSQSSDELIRNTVQAVNNHVHTITDKLQQELHQELQKLIINIKNKQERANFTEATARAMKLITSAWSKNYTSSILNNILNSLNILQCNEQLNNLETWLQLLYSDQYKYENTITASIYTWLNDYIMEHYTEYENDNESHEKFIHDAINTTLNNMKLENMLKEQAVKALTPGSDMQKLINIIPQAVKHIYRTEHQKWREYLNYVEEQINDIEQQQEEQQYYSEYTDPDRACDMYKDSNYGM